MTSNISKKRKLSLIKSNPYHHDTSDECFICGFPFQSMNIQFIDKHLNECLNKLENNDQSIQSIDKTYYGLRSNDYKCVICDINLSKRGLTSRCQHIKRCAKQHGVGIRELLQMISPENFEDVLTQVEMNQTGQIGQSLESSDSITSVDIQEQKPNAHAVLLAHARVKWGSASSGSAATQSGGGDKGNRGQDKWKGKKRAAPTVSDSEPTYSYTPDYKKIQVPPMTTPVIVDGFSVASSSLSDCYFLTHFHSDHYTGLSKAFAHGKIYCSPTTCSLVKLRLGVKACYLHALALEKKHTILCGGYPVEVTLTEANHCPGAVCILFVFHNGKRILHTGDFRWCDDLLQSSKTLKWLANSSDNERNLTVYLDTTYCDPAHVFPAQREAIDAVKQCVREEMKIASTLFVFGAYGIGKERVYMSVAEEHEMKVHVDKTRWKTMLCYDWPMKDHARLTTDPNATWLWVVPMNSLNFDALSKLRSKKEGCRRVVAFQPTGWSYSGRSPGNSSRQVSSHKSEDIVKPRRKDGNVIYSVPYSEHSSFTELVEFIRLYSPQRVVPTVNTSREKVKSQLDYLRKASSNSNVSEVNAVLAMREANLKQKADSTILVSEFR